MNKKLSYLITSIVLVLSMSACSGFGNPTQKYINAFIKTESADSMEVKTECKINIDLSKASTEMKTKFEKYKEITLNLDEAIDNKKEKMKIDGFLSAGDIVLNPSIYGEDKKTYIKYGDKYIDASNKDDTEASGSDGNFEGYDKLYREFSTIWKDAMANEILASKGNSIIYTPDGDIKVTNLSLELTDEKQRNILNKLAEAVSKSTEFKKNLTSTGRSYKPENVSDVEFEKGVDDWFTNLPQKLKDVKDKYILEDLKLMAKVDKDSYIIDQTVEGILKILHNGEVKISFKMHTTRWNINSNNIKVEIPKIEKKDLMDINEFKAKNSKLTKSFLENMPPQK